MNQPSRIALLYEIEFIIGVNIVYIMIKLQICGFSIYNLF